MASFALPRIASLLCQCFILIFSSLYIIPAVSVHFGEFCDGTSFCRGENEPFHFLNFKPHEKRRLALPSGLEEVPKKAIYVKHEVECHFACLDEKWCFSMNFKTTPEQNGSKLCEVLSTDKHNHSSYFIQDKEFVYFGLETPCDSAPCSRHGNCIALYTKRDYYCACVPGYTGRTCHTDVDECTSNIHTCNKANGTCTNTVGNYTCACKPGFEGDGLVCLDIDECERDIHTCNMANGTCTNTVGNYTCVCKPGFEGDGRVCLDIDECEQGIHTCNKANGTCTNTLGNYTCACKPGFEGDGRVCLDIDECQRDIHTCNKANGTCTNTVGNYTCACKPGFEGDGRVCLDINECKQGIDTCNKANGTCINTMGSYTCTCKSGFGGDGRLCIFLAPQSDILIQYGTQNGKTALASYLKPVMQSLTKSRWIRCWRALTDGWATATFHKNCDAKASTVTIVRDGNRIFGGYTDKHWISLRERTYSGSSKSFLFSLYNNGDSPMKFPIKTNKVSFAIRGYYGYGPTFGLGHDLHIADNARSNANSFARSSSYQTPPGCKTTGSFCNFFAGTNHFSPSDIEVFYETSGVESTLLSSNTGYQTSLTSILLPVLNTGRWKPCWRAGTDGWTHSMFHSRCDHVGATVTIVQVGSRLFGGYLDKPFDSTSGYITSTKAFLFSLTNANGFSPIKFNIRTVDAQHAAYFGSSHVPIFGHGHDLYLGTKPNNVGHTWPRTYEAPPGCTTGNACPFMAGSSPFTPSNIHVFYENTLPSDILLGKNVKYLSVLKGFLRPVSTTVSRWAKCWDTATDNLQQFHNRCDNLGPTVTVIRVGPYIFGGYTDKSWQRTAGYVASNKAFIFSLYNVNGFAPAKFNIKSDQTGHAIYNSQTYGPTFGSGHDIYIGYDSNGNSGSCTHTSAYNGPSQCSRECTFFANTYRFTPNEVEVFYQISV